MDYVAALNARMKRGITPETNAVVLLWKAMGPRPEGDASIVPPAHFEYLGIPPPPEVGDYFAVFGKREGRHLEHAAERLAVPTQRPWSAAEFPDVSDWLTANAKPLALMVEASKRPAYYFPLVPDPSSVRRTFYDILLPLAQKSRAVVQALIVRAMLHLDGGRHADAWDDLLAAHRLARHVGSGGTLIEGLVGCASDIVTSAADLVFLDRIADNAVLLEKSAKDLRALPPLPDVGKRVSEFDRFSLLDLVMQVDRIGLAAFPGVEAGGQDMVPELLDGIDLDPTLRAVNRWTDRMAAVCRRPTHAERKRSWAELSTELRELKNRVATDEYRAAVQNAPDAAQAKGRALGDILTSLLPAAEKVRDAADRAAQYQANTLTAIALARYRLDVKSYPPALAALVPKYLPAVPKDRFTEKSLVYRPRADGYLLYSVGVNEKDDGGGEDDIAVRMPPRP